MVMGRPSPAKAEALLRQRFGLRHGSGSGVL